MIDVLISSSSVAPTQQGSLTTLESESIPEGLGDWTGASTTDLDPFCDLNDEWVQDTSISPLSPLQ